MDINSSQLDIDRYWLNINGSRSNIDGYYLGVKRGGVINKFNLSSFKSSRRRVRGKYGSVGGYILTSISISLI